MTRLLGVLLLCIAATAGADERILAFHSEIRVMQNGFIEVTETIRVRSERNRILRGIYRDLPTEYFDRFNNRYEVRIEPLAVLRNDQPEWNHTVSIRGGQRTYFGDAEIYIPAGVHTYTFRYRASRMLGFFENHDEIYWNVTGFDWAFPIDAASARVILDFDSPPAEVTHEAYTGPFGAQGRDYVSRVEGNGIVYFESTKPLSAVNGLTIVVGWPKGYVEAPTNWTRAGWLVADNVNLLVALGGLGLLFIYYVPVWRAHGKDPEEGVIFARYQPPEGFSPASLRYIEQMYYDDKVMTAAVVNLAVKGYLRIDHFGKQHTLVRTEPPAEAPPLAPGEKELYEELFAGGKAITLDNDNHQILGKAKSAHRESLKDDYKHKYFQTNGYLNLPGIAIAIGATIAAFNVGRGPAPLVIAVVIAMFLAMVWFAIIMKRPTLRGRKLLDEMLGFRDYLEVAEKDEMNLRNPPEKTPELFERYLPYALALGVDQEWGEKFAAVLAAVRGPDGGDYRPGWYGGDWNTSRLASTTHSFSKGLSSSISSSVTPPGSSSGGGGGGSSGGGGGGGGGGGW